MHQVKLKKAQFFPVSFVIPMRNSATTILKTLEDIIKQKYPIREMIVVDNKSSDNSVELVLSFAKKSKIPIKVVRRRENKGVGSSYNLGVKKATSPYVIFMHSDSSLLSEHELEKLTEPLRNDSKIVASYPKVLLSKGVWERYNFWEKCLFARAVGKETPGFNGKFDCIKKEVFLKIGGFDEENFGEDIGIGGEDADLYLRLAREGEMVLSGAKVMHLHYLGSNYKVSDWMKNRKLLAKSYGRLIRLQGKFLPLQTYGKGLLIPLGVFIFLIKPMLATLPLLPHMHILGLTLLIVYAFFNSYKMYTNFSTLVNPRILLLPFLDIFLVYYETFWMLEAFLFISRGISPRLQKEV